MGRRKKAWKGKEIHRRPGAREKRTVSETAAGEGGQGTVPGHGSCLGPLTAQLCFPLLPLPLSLPAFPPGLVACLPD